MQTKQQGLRTRLRNNQAEIRRLMVEYEIFGAIVVNGDGIKDVNDAVKCHGRLATLIHIMQARETSRIKIKLCCKKFLRT